MEVRFDGMEVGEEFGGFVVFDVGVDNDIIIGDLVDGGGDFVFVIGLEGLDDMEDFGVVVVGGGGVGEDVVDGFFGVDEEDGVDGEGNVFFIDVGGVLVVDFVVIYVSECLWYW